MKDIDASDPEIAANLLGDLTAAREFLQGIDGLIEVAAHRLGIAIACNFDGRE